MTLNLDRRKRHLGHHGGSFVQVASSRRASRPYNQTHARRFPIGSGLRVEWDHNLPPGKRVKSIRQVNHPSEEDDEVDNPEEMVDFVEQPDGTRVEVKQKKVGLGDEVKNESGGRLYRVVSLFNLPAHFRSPENTWQKGTTGSKRSRGENSSSTTKTVKSCLASSDLSSLVSRPHTSLTIGSAYIFRHKQLVSAHQKHLSSKTKSLLSRARNEHNTSPQQSPNASPRSSKLALLSPTSEKPEYSAPGSPISESHPRRHVVKHDWSSIRAALWIAKHEHMSTVDDFKGHDIRRQGSQHDEAAMEPKESKAKDDMKIDTTGGFKDDAQATYFVNEESKKELRALGEDLAIVCPLIDGRMKDLGAD